MAKSVVWTETAQKSRQEILEYWNWHNKSKEYPRKLSMLFRKKIELLQEQYYLGKPTDFKDVRVTLVSHFSIFFKVTDTQIIIVGLWDNRRNPDDLHRNLSI
jgi:toxin YoeB